MIFFSADRTGEMGRGFQKPFLANLSDSEKLLVNSEKENPTNTAFDLK